MRKTARTGRVYEFGPLLALGQIQKGWRCGGVRVRRRPLLLLLAAGPVAGQTRLGPETGRGGTGRQRGQSRRRGRGLGLVDVPPSVV